MPDTQYFTNIDGKYVKDAEARQQLNDLEDYVESLDQPWQPLQDGYSNFWFELSNDTLSPWLNFSAKTENAVIDWGDGSGEVSLDTLTPTHTYSKAGKYVVKVKGVTGIAAQNVEGDGKIGKYKSALTAVEANNEITSLATLCFAGCCGIEHIRIPSVTMMPSSAFFTCTNLLDIELNSAITYIPSSVFQHCVSLTNIILPSSLQSIGASCFQYALSLTEITIPATVYNFSANAFNQAMNLVKIHIQATVPATITSNTFNSLPSDYIIYVPVGYAETYKAASGWSTYADHILEEGQTPNRMMLAKFNSTKTEEVKDDELYKDENR